MPDQTDACAALHCLLDTLSEAILQMHATNTPLPEGTVLAVISEIVKDAMGRNFDSDAHMTAPGDQAGGVS
jgi:hypothetical protein